MSGPALAIYARVSTDAQDLSGQVHELEQEAERRGLPIARRYLEKVSGTGRVERAAYEQLLAEARDPARPWSELLVWSLDRFSREERFTKAVDAIWTLEAAGIRFRSLREPVLDTPSDGTPNLARELLLALLPVLASWESRRRSERTRVAMREIREGRRATRSGLPVGRRRESTPELLEQIRRLREEERLPWSKIALRVHKPSSTCRKWFSAARRARTAPPTETPRVTKGPEGFGAVRDGPTEVGTSG